MTDASRRATDVCRRADRSESRSSAGSSAGRYGCDAHASTPLVSRGAGRRCWRLASLGHDRAAAASPSSCRRTTLVASVLLVMALGLETRAMWNAVRRPTAAALAVAVNLGVVPPLAWLAGRLLEPSLAEGMIVAARCRARRPRRRCGRAAPAATTRSPCSRRWSTSLACFVVTPAWLRVARRPHRRRASRVSASWCVRLRAGRGAADRRRANCCARSRRCGDWATRHAHGSEPVRAARHPLDGVRRRRGVRRADRAARRAASRRWPGRSRAMIALVAAVHTGGVVRSATGPAGRLGLPRADQIGVAFAGSQKTLMVGLAIAIDFGGLAVLPMVAYHVEQLLIDTVLADRLRAREGRRHRSAGSPPSGPPVELRVPRLRRRSRRQMPVAWLAWRLSGPCPRAARRDKLWDSTPPTSPRLIREVEPCKTKSIPHYYETQVTCGCGNIVRHAQHPQGAEGRYLQRLPPVLHGQAEVRRHGRPHREVQEQVRQERLSPACRQRGKKAKAEK